MYYVLIAHAFHVLQTHALKLFVYVYWLPTLVCEIVTTSTSEELAMNLEASVILAFAVTVFGGALALAVVAASEVIASVIG